MDSVTQGPLSLARLLVWADPGATATAALWPAYRLVDMQASDGVTDDVRLTAFGVLWHRTVQDLVDRLLQHLAWQRTGVVGFVRLGAGR